MTPRTKGRSRTSTRSKAAAPQLNDVLLTLSNPDKVFWPDEGYTKLGLARYYEMAFPKLQPYLENRILTLERCPDGLRGECFYQKEKPKGLPPGTPTKRIRNESGRREFTNYVVGGSLATQLALVNLGCVAVHVMNSTASSPRQPDWICFDLDPESGKFADAARAGLYVKEALDSLRLFSFPKTSGGRGMHVLIPIRRGPDSSGVLSFAGAVAERVAAAHPKELTFEHSIARRKGRVYVDPFRNAFGQTVVAPYSVRLQPKAPVSTPLDWKEVTPTLDPADFNIGNFEEQRLRRADPWAAFFRSRQSLSAASKLLRNL